ncbi:glyceraldehyde 3-phosphate dehydrogenase NAD-binding domain-containing protein [Gallaecimonas kandeliae]|uniref:type I glyceraldehyde-3-phosphate dehydrogenase n=1 Tax=Gallaecimonas kandeliae TaxID=3029055 RepID=UPI0026475540|nr:glyceraldehyde 3-phosphate dehydrogenase NAD-binding domain-containing protein [Gallaecimonas kandeliae]WKE65134.1 glyceraldehyde 3-phosphate dehydrogenase NAD-binding domain-containing protein [Gallaecimonas kandeliae]
MSYTVAINGFGRIGRALLRALHERNLLDELQVVAVNDIAEPAAMAHLFQYDSTHGRLDADIRLEGNSLLLDGHAIRLLSEPDPQKLPLAGVDLLIDCTGIIRSRMQAEAYLRAGAGKVLISNPADDGVDDVIVYGINEQRLRPTMKVVSNASCTTNCLVPVVSLLDEAFGIARGLITSIHAAMNDQQVLDSYQPNLRLSRAMSQSMVPVDTQLGKGVGRVLPQLQGKFEAISVRVPTINVSALDLSLQLEKDTSAEAVNALLAEAGQGRFKGILQYCTAPLVSVDHNHNAHSVIVDGTQTRVTDGSLLKLLLWFDNEWGFANRLVDTARCWLQKH